MAYQGGITDLRNDIRDLEETLAGCYSSRAELITAMALQGMSQREIGALWGVSQVRVAKILRDYGVMYESHH